MNIVIATAGEIHTSKCLLNCMPGHPNNNKCNKPVTSELLYLIFTYKCQWATDRRVCACCLP